MTAFGSRNTSTVRGGDTIRGTGAVAVPISARLGVALGERSIVSTDRAGIARLGVALGEQSPASTDRSASTRAGIALGEQALVTIGAVPISARLGVVLAARSTSSTVRNPAASAGVVLGARESLSAAQNPSGVIGIPLGVEAAITTARGGYTARIGMVLGIRAITGIVIGDPPLVFSIGYPVAVVSTGAPHDPSELAGSPR